MRSSEPIISRSGIRLLVRNAILTVPILVCTYLGFCALMLLLYSTVMPPITGIQLQRLVEARLEGEDYSRDYRPISYDEIPQDLWYAVVAAEDGRFFEHRGIDWEAVQEARIEIEEGRRVRGGSTITQQLVKNLYLTTHQSFIRKGFEAILAYKAEFLLSKERILLLYLNVIEWGPGIYGAEAAAQHHYQIPAANVTRYQAAALAACIPAPRSRSPHRMGWYTNIILHRMAQHGW